MKRNKLMSWILSIVMVLSVFGSMPAISFADDSGQANTYNVTVKVGPSTVDVDFYECAGFDDNGYDKTGEELAVEDKGVADGYHVYEFSAPKGTYSFRGSDANGASLGGMTFDVPKAANVAGSDSGSDVEITLRQVGVWAANKLGGNYITDQQYTTRIEDADGKLATAGTAYTAEDGTYRYPHLLFVNSNAELFNMYVVPSGEVKEEYDLTEGYAINQALTAGTSVLTKQIDCSASAIQLINAPKNAKVQVFNQQRNFKTVEIQKASKLKKSDGTYDWIFPIPSTSKNLSYRVSMDGKVTKAGWLDSNNRELTIEFGEEENPKETVDAVTKALEESSILLNINDKNCLDMEVGDKFKLRAYRAAWQIVNSVVSNIMIEPDFHLEKVSGDDVLDIESLSGGNASDNWAWLTAKGEGVGIYKMTYDAIDVANSSNNVRYGAIDPAREGYFVVNVGGNHDTEIDWNIGDWDAEMDTVYFFEDEGVFNFTPKAEGDISVKVAYKNGAFANVKKEDDGSFNVPVKDGNSIVCVQAGDSAEYMILKGGKLSYTIENKTTGDKKTDTTEGLTIKQGDEVAISFDGLSMPIPKFSGIYNPGFGNTTKVRYTLNGKDAVTSAGTQYDIVTKNTVTFTATEAGTNTLTGGNIPMTMMCNPANPWGQHRTLTDNGVGANFNASSVPGDFSILPDITFSVTETEGYVPPEGEDPLEFTSFQVGAMGSYNTIFSSAATNRTTLLALSDYTVEHYPENCLYVRGRTVDAQSAFKVKLYKLGEEENAIEKEVTGDNTVAATDFLIKNLNDICMLEMQAVSKDGDASPTYKAYLYKQSADTTALQFLMNLKVTPQLSSNEKISGESGALVFNSETTEYGTMVYGTDQITITPTAANNTSEIKVNGEIVASGKKSNTIQLTDETTAIKVTIGDLTYTINVTKVGLDKIKASSSRTDYVDGDSLDTSKLTVTGMFGEEERTLTGYTVSPETLTTDTSEVEISFGGKTCKLAVSVKTKEQNEKDILAAVKAADADGLEAIIVDNASYLGIDSTTIKNYQKLEADNRQSLNEAIAGKTFASLKDLAEAFMDAYTEVKAEEDLQKEVNGYLTYYAIKNALALAEDLENNLTIDNCSNYTYQFEKELPYAYNRLSTEAKYHVRETKAIMDQIVARYEALLEERTGLVNLAKDSLDNGKEVLEATAVAADGTQLDDSVLWVTEEEANAFQAKVDEFEDAVTRVGPYGPVNYSGLEEATGKFDMEVSAFKKLRKTGEIKVSEVRDKALESLNSSYDASLYGKEDQRYIELVIESAEKDLQDAGTSAEVAEILAKAIEKIEAVEAGGSSSDLDKAKAEAFDKVNAYTTAADQYRAAEQLKLLTAVISAQSEISAATEESRIQESLKKLEASVKALKTDADYKTAAMEAAKLNLTVKADTYSSAKLSWNNVAEAAGYEVYRSTGKAYTKIKTVTGTSFRDTKLATGTKYSYKVKAYAKADGKTITSKESNVKTVTPALSAPVKVKAKAGAKKATISWGKTDGANGYKIYRATKKNGKYKAVKTIKKQRTVKYVDKKVKKNKRYYYKVRAYKNVGGKKVYSKYSKIVKVRVK